MTFTFKLARRLALAHFTSATAIVGAASLVLYAGACAPGKPLEGGLEPPPDSVLAVSTFPDSVTLQPNEFVDFTAVGDLPGGGQSALRVDWTATGGTITAEGRYTAGSDTGTKKVIGRYRNGKADTSTVVITSPGGGTPVLTRIDVTPTTAALLPGASQQFSATGVLSDGSNSAVSVTWSATGGTVDATGFYFAPQTAGTFLVVAQQQGGSFADTARVTVTTPPPTLAAVELTPPTASLQFGQTQQFSALGRLTDNSTTSIAVTWTATGGTVNGSGLYTAGNTAGTFRVIAAAATGQADTSVVTITAPTITAITLTPATVSLQSGQTQQFVASATLSNGATQANPPVSWSATGGNINTTGLFTAGVTAGTFRVIASSGNGRADTSSVTIALPTITAITVTPATASLSTGATQQFTASATLSNGGTQTSPAVIWTATGGTITTAGLYTAGNTAGTFRVIAASSNGRADTSSVTISAPTITALNLTPATVNLAPSATQQFSVSATLSTGGTQTNPAVTWSATGGTITTAGLYTAGSTAGTFRVIVAAANGVADTSSVTIAAPTVTAIVVSPAAVTVPVGQTQQFSASATLSTGGSQSNPAVTWSATGGTINASGLYTAGATAGTFRVIVVQAGGTLADTATVTVSAAGSGPYPNRPANFTTVQGELDMSQPIPAGTGERYLAGFNNTWSVISDNNGSGSNWSQMSDATAPFSSPSVWRQRQAAGAYGGGVIGTGSGEGFGNIGRPISASSVYASFWIKFSPGYFFHPISHKLVRMEVSGAVQAFLLQLRHNDDYFRASDEQLGIGYDPIVAGLGGEPSTNVWHQVEMLVIRGSAGTVKVWVDGQLRINQTGVAVATSGNFTTFSIEGYMGGGGFTLTQDQFFYLDHIFIASP